MTGADLAAILKKHPIGVVCGLITVACAVFLYLNFGNIAASQAENEARTTEANKMISNVRNSANLAEQVAEVQALSKDLESRLMRAGQLAVNLQYFYKLEAETEIKLADVRQAGMNRTKTQYVTVPFSLTVQGTFPQLTNFLNRLQAGRHFCRVTSATFNKGGVGASDVGGEMSLTLNLEILGQL